jgi:colanic acid biosynthesis glycosyl transferase WcaI
VKILYICQYFPPEMGAPAARVSELARYWVRAGHEVTVLTGFPNHPTGKVHSAYRGKLRRLLMRENFEGAKVVRTWLWPLPNRKALERVLNYTSFWISASITSGLLDRPDVVIATSPQLLVGLAGWWAARVHDAPFVFEVRDLWPESLVAVGVRDSESLMTRTLRRIAAFLYRSADKIVVVSPAFKSEIAQNYSIDAGRIALVENGVETGLFTSDGDSKAMRVQLGLEKKFVVGYIGTMGDAHGLDAVLDAAAILQVSNSEIVLLFIGEGSRKEHVVNRASELGLTNVRFLPQQSRETIPEFIRASNVCLVPLRKSDVFKTVIPTKMLEFLSCGRPVILSVEGQAREIIEKSGGGIAIEPDNPEALAKAILQLKDSPARCAELGQSGHAFIDREFSRESTARRYTDVLGKVVQQWGIARARRS